jgi:protein involved in polysaccharide export with SLBB domain
MLRHPSALAALLAALVFGIGSGRAGAQTQGSGAQLETREGLTRAAEAAEAAKRSDQARLIRDRLRDGDFVEGDVIVVRLELVPPQFTFDTLYFVEPGRVIRFANMGTLQLTGVLRSELEAAIEKHLSAHLVRPGVRATSVVQFQVDGMVGQPGFHAVPPYVPLRNVINAAGGFTSMADPTKITVRRGGETILDRDDARQAMLSGLSVDRLNLRQGDAITVGGRGRDWVQILQIGLGLVSITLAIITVTQRN